jgi:hypothetical protein
VFGSAIGALGASDMNSASFHLNEAINLNNGVGQEKRPTVESIRNFELICPGNFELTFKRKKLPSGYGIVPALVRLENREMGFTDTPWVEASKLLSHSALLWANFV